MEETVEYRIRNVTLFPDRARVQCIGKLNLAKEASTLLFDELPLSIDPSSLQVGGSGTAKVRILGVDISRHHYEQTPSERVRDLEEELDRLKDEQNILDDRLIIWDAQLEHLQGLRLATDQYAKGLSKGRQTIEDQTQIMVFLRKQEEEIRSKQRTIRVEQRELERRISKIERELNEWHSAKAQYRFQGQVAIEVLEPGEFRPELAYIVSKAGWRPLYDIRFAGNDAGNHLEINLMAQIVQRTGQDWNNVQLTVSTARPALTQRFPEVKPWYVDELHIQPRAGKVRATAPQPAMAAFSAQAEDRVEAVADEPPLQEAEIARAKSLNEGTAVRFVVAGNWDIPSDGSPHKMVLTSFTPDPKVDYLSIPRHTDAVFRRATIVNNSEGNLLAGEASLFVEDEFIGKTRFEHTAVGEELELLLGVEEGIIVERELTRRSVDKRLLRENRVLQYAYEMKLKNLLQNGVTVELQDQIPVSKHEQIKIKLERISPEPSKRSDLNIMEWDLKLDPGAEVTVGYTFAVEHPSEMRIWGLNE